MKQYYRAKFIEADLRMGLFQSCVSAFLFVAHILTCLVATFILLTEKECSLVFLLGLGTGISGMLLWQSVSKVVRLVRELKLRTTNSK